MALLDTVQDVFRKVLPPKEGRIPASNSGIGNGGHSMFTDEDMIVSKPTIILHTTQAFFNFLAMACFASVAGFQSHWKIGVSGLSGFALFVTISGIFLSLFMLLVPVMYEKYDKFARLARALKETRVGFILGGSGAIFSLLISFIVTISAWTEPGCKNPENDPHKDLGKDFQIALNGWCNTKKAAAIFMWIAFAAWAGTLAFTVRDWRQGSNNRARDPPFRPPNMAPGTDFPDETDTVHGRDRTDDSESVYEPLPPIRRQTSDDFASGGPARSPFSDDNRYSGASGGGYGGGGGGYGSGGGGGYAAGRPSMDAYGAFSDPAPSGYGASSPGAGSGAMPQPGVSRTMQYADPYAAVRASIAGGGQASGPPGYDNQGYR